MRGRYSPFSDLDICTESFEMPGSMLRRFCAIAAHQHGAPAPAVALADIQEPQRALRAFAMTNVGKIGVHQKIRHCVGNGLQQGIGGLPVLNFIQNQRGARGNLNMTLSAPQ
jgi:hypothetical protein